MQDLKNAPRHLLIRDANTEAQAKRRAVNRWTMGRNAEIDYARKLRGVAKQVGAIVEAFAPDGTPTDPAALQAMLDRYAELLRPWARAVATSMLEEAARRNRAAWLQHANEMGLRLRKEIEGAPTGEMMRALLDEQVDLITSLPREAAQRVQKLVTESLITSSRATEIAQEIMASGEVTASRATLIARTESARASTMLTQARAMHVGSPGYIWHSQKDADTRPSHKAMNGQFVLWDQPPTFVEGVHKKSSMTGHAGCLPNCRCWAEPVLNLKG